MVRYVVAAVLEALGELDVVGIEVDPPGDCLEILYLVILLFLDLVHLFDFRDRAEHQPKAGCSAASIEAYQLVVGLRMLWMP